MSANAAAVCAVGDRLRCLAFEVNAVDYLLKPFDKKRVVQSVEKAKQKLSAAPTSSERLESLINLLEQQQKPQQQKILLRSAGRLILVDQRDVCFATIDEGGTVHPTAIRAGSRRYLPADAAGLDREVRALAERSKGGRLSGGLLQTRESAATPGL